MILRILGCCLMVVGIVLVCNPELLVSKPIPVDTFEAIERRIWWGLLISAGALVTFHQQFRPWLLTLAAVGSAFLFGLLVARLVGIALDGSVARQWLYVGIECVLLAPLVWWYFRMRATQSK